MSNKKLTIQQIKTQITNVLMQPQQYRIDVISLEHNDQYDQGQLIDYMDCVSKPNDLYSHLNNLFIKYKNQQYPLRINITNHFTKQEYDIYLKDHQYTYDDQPQYHTLKTYINSLNNDILKTEIHNEVNYVKAFNKYNNYKYTY